MPPTAPYETPDAKPTDTPGMPELPVGGGPDPGQPLGATGPASVGGGPQTTTPSGDDDQGIATYTGMSDHAPADLGSNAPWASAAPAASPPPAQPQPPASDPLGAALGQYGVDVSRFGSPREALGEVIRLANEGRQNLQYAELGRRAAPYWDQFEQIQRGAQQQTASQAAEQPAAEATAEQTPQWQWNAPEWNPRWLDQIDPNTGQLRPGADPTIITKIQEYQDWRESQLTNLLSDPSQLIGQAVAPKLHEMKTSVEQLVNQRVQQALDDYAAKQQQQQLAQQAEQRWNSIQDKLFQKGPQGYLTDPTTGQPALTPQGRLFQQAYQRGLQTANDVAALTGQQVDESRLQAYAENFAYGQLQEAEQSGMFSQQAGNGQPASPAAQQSPAASYEQLAAQQRKTFMEEALAGQRAAGQRDGTIPDNPAVDPAQDPNRVPTADELVAKTIRDMGLRRD